MNYETLRHFADSYGLLFMGLAWLVLCGWGFRPGARRRSHEAASMIFRDGDHG